MAYAILVDFHLKPGTREEFRRLIDINAGRSVRDEEGCSRFDVLEVADDADRIVLYEVYRDRAAFDAHLETPHYALFNGQSADLVADKSASEFNLVFEGSA